MQTSPDQVRAAEARQPPAKGVLRPTPQCGGRGLLVVQRGRPGVASVQAGSASLSGALCCAGGPEDAGGRHWRRRHRRRRCTSRRRCWDGCLPSDPAQRRQHPPRCVGRGGAGHPLRRRAAAPHNPQGARGRRRAGRRQQQQQPGAGGMSQWTAACCCSCDPSMCGRNGFCGCCRRRRRTPLAPMAPLPAPTWPDTRRLLPLPACPAV